LEYALRLPQAILDHYAGRPVSPLQLAKALEMDPKGSQIRVLSGAAIAFGLVEGGAQATSISVTALAQRILRPRAEGEDIQAKREAVLLPRVFGDFLRQYDGNAFPRQDIALNVLEGMGVPREKAAEVLERIDSSARSVGFIEEIKGKTYVTLQGVASVEPVAESELSDIPVPNEPAQIARQHTPAVSHPTPVDTRITLPPRAIEPRGAALTAAIADDQRRRRVFITHGKNRDLVDPIRKLLEYGELEPVVSVDRQSVSKPVPEKVLDDMRASGAAIIHVDADRTIIDKEDKEHVLLNPNVLIEIGAAMAFYGRRFILLVRDGVKMPSNLQGLYEVRYTGDNLDAHATIKLLEAIKDIKNHALPTAGDSEN
jgi:predicted nucleotide-binding protein